MAGTQDMSVAVMNGLFSALAHFYFPEASRRGPLVLCVEGEEVKVQGTQWEQGRAEKVTSTHVTNHLIYSKELTHTVAGPVKFSILLSTSRGDS